MRLLAALLFRLSRVVFPLTDRIPWGLRWRQIPGRKSDGTGQSELASERAAATAECDTLIGRVTGLLLDRNKPDLPDIVEVWSMPPWVSIGRENMRGSREPAQSMGSAGRLVI